MGCGCQKNKSGNKNKYQNNDSYLNRYAYLTPEQIKEKERQEAEKPKREGQN